MVTDSPALPGPTRDARVISSCVIASLPLVAAVILAGDAGGYFFAQYGRAAIVLSLAALAVAVVLTVRATRWPGALAISAWGGLVGWQVVSGGWSPDAAASLRVAALTCLYTAALALGVFAMRRGAASLVPVLGLTLGAVTVICGWGVAARLLPGIVGGDDVVRLTVPISYWNSLGALAGFGVVLGLGMASLATTRRWASALCAASVPLFLVCIVCTVSRGAAICLLIGLVSLVAIGPHRLRIAAVLVGVAIVSAPVVVYVNGSSALVALQGTLPEHGREGAIAFFVLLVTMCAAGGVAALAVRAVSALSPTTTRRASVAVLTGAVTLFALATILVTRDSGGPIDWTKAQVTAFKSFEIVDNPNVSFADRLASSAGTGRWQNWGVGADMAGEAPVRGTGAGSYQFRWDRQRDIPQDVTNAHSLYLEVWAEVGVVGFVLLLIPLILAALALVRLRRTGVAAGGAAAAAGLVLWVHAAGDWDWQLPTAMIPAVVVVGALIGAWRPSAADMRRPSLIAGVVVAGASLFALVFLSAPLTADSEARASRSTARAGDLAGAVTQASRAIEATPAWAAPWQLRGNLLSEIGRPGEADASFAAALVRSPDDWSIAADWADALADRGQTSAARLLLARAKTLNPLEERIGAIEAGLPPR